MKQRFIITLLIIIAITFTSQLYANTQLPSRTIPAQMQNLTARLETEDCDLIFLGNSMLESNVNTSITTGELSNLSGKPVKSLDILISGHTFATWYLIIKNKIQKSTQKGIPIVIIDWKQNPGIHEIIDFEYPTVLQLVEPPEDQLFRITGGELRPYDIIGRYYTPYLYRNTLVSGIKNRFIMIMTLNQITNSSTILEQRFTIGAFKPPADSGIEKTETIFDLIVTLLPEERKQSDNYTDQGDENMTFGLFSEIINITRTQFPLFYVDSRVNPDYDTKELKRFRKNLSEYLRSHNISYIDMNAKEELNDSDLFADSGHYWGENYIAKNSSANLSGIPLNSKIIADELWEQGIFNG